MSDKSGSDEQVKRYAQEIDSLRARIAELEKSIESNTRSFIELTSSQFCQDHTHAVASVSFPEFEKRISGKCLFCHENRIADLERVLKDTCELMDKCAGRLNVFVAQHVGSRDEYFVFELNRLSVCAGALDAMSRKAIAEIKSVLGKGE